MSIKIFVVLSLVAFSSGSLGAPSEADSPTLLRIESETLPNEVQKYLEDTFADLSDRVTELELDQPPQALQEIADNLLKQRVDTQGKRMKRKVVVCRYVAIRNNRTRKTVVILRCPR